MSLAVFFIYGTSAGLSRVIMLTVPMQTRPFALALQTLGLVPTPSRARLRPKRRLGGWTLLCSQPPRPPQLL